jgi:hypothetical protein
LPLFSPKNGERGDTGIFLPPNKKKDEISEVREWQTVLRASTMWRRSKENAQ